MNIFSLDQQTGMRCHMISPGRGHNWLLSMVFLEQSSYFTITMSNYSVYMDVDIDLLYGYTYIYIFDIYIYKYMDMDLLNTF